MSTPLSEHPGLVVVFGNPDAHALLADPDPVKAAAGERTVQPVQTSHPSTVVMFPEGTPLIEALTTLTSPQGIVAAHAAGDVDFVACSDPLLAQLLAQHYNAPVRDLDGELLGVHDPQIVGEPAGEATDEPAQDDSGAAAEPSDDASAEPPAEPAEPAAEPDAAQDPTGQEPAAPPAAPSAVAEPASAPPVPLDGGSPPIASPDVAAPYGSPNH